MEEGEPAWTADGGADGSRGEVREQRDSAGLLLASEALSHVEDVQENLDFARSVLCLLDGGSHTVRQHVFGHLTGCQNSILFQYKQAIINATQ